MVVLVLRTQIRGVIWTWDAEDMPPPVFEMDTFVPITSKAKFKNEKFVCKNMSKPIGIL